MEYSLPNERPARALRHPLTIVGPERAGKDVFLGDVFTNYPKPDRPVDFVISENETVLAVGLARYDSDRGGAQEDDRTGQYRDCAQEVIADALRMNRKKAGYA